MNEVMTTATQAGATILCALLSLLAAKAVSMITAYTAKLSTEALAIDDAATRDLINDALARVETLATKTVECIEQTAAASIRKLAKTSTDPDKDYRAQLVALGLEARETVIKNLSNDYKQALVDAGIHLEGYVQSVVESKVLALKSAPTATAG